VKFFNRKSLKKNHKGLSTIVITLIIILISLVAVGIVWVVVRNVINTGTKEVTLGQFTLDAKIKDVNIDNSSNNVSLSVRRNAGIGEFSKMNFVFSDGKNSEVITQPVSLNELEEKRFTFHLSILNVSNLISISIVPLIKQDNKEILGNVLDKYTIGSQTSICVGGSCMANTSVLCELNTYYIDYAGGNDANNGTCTNSAWKHVPGDNNAVGISNSTTLQAGDIVVFKGNVIYFGRIDVDWSGNSSGYINYKSGHLLASQWGTDRAIVDGSGSILNTGLGTTGLFSINAKSYIKIEGMKIQNVPFCSDGIGYCGNIAFIGNSGGNIIITNSVLYNGSDNGVMLQGLWNTGTNPSNFTIINTAISNMGDHGIQIRGGIDNVLIQGNIIHDNGLNMTIFGNGIFAGAGGTAYCTGLTIRGNTIYNNPTKGHTNLGGHNILVEDNYMYCNDSTPQAFGLLISTEFYQTGMHTENVTIRNNIIEVNGTYEGAIRINNPTLITGYIADVKIYNNYIIQRGQYYGIYLGRGISNDSRPIRNITIKNNYIESLIGMKQVIYTETNTTYGFNAQSNHYRYGSTTVPFKWNGTVCNFTYWNTTLGFDTFNHTQNTDPLLTNYYPEVGSPLINTGLDLSATGFSDDKNGVTRPQGSAWDIGAYEYY